MWLLWPGFTLLFHLSQDYYGKVKSNCEYYFDYGNKVSTKPSRNSPWRNRLLNCSVDECDQVVWSYNMKEHFNLQHADQDHLNNVEITAEDITGMNKSNKKQFTHQ